MLNLQPGDRGQVKPMLMPMPKILKTLNGHGCNRRLWFDPAKVKEPSIMLDEPQCSGHAAFLA